MRDMSNLLSKRQPWTGLGRGKRNSGKSESLNVMVDALIFQLPTAHCVVISSVALEMNWAKIIQNHTMC